MHVVLRCSVVFAVTLFATAAHAQQIPGGITYVQDAAAVAVWDSLMAMGLPVEPGPGGPVDRATAADSLACSRDAATTLVTCKAEAQGTSYASEAADKVAPMFDALSAALGPDAATTLTVKTVQCYRNSMPVANAICGFTRGE